MASKTASVGSPAPDFNIPSIGGTGTLPSTSSLADYRGKWVALIFYPRDFSLVCPTELTAFSARSEAFAELDCHVLGISTDDVATHRRWLATPRQEGGIEGLRFPLLADEDGRVAALRGAAE